MMIDPRYIPDSIRLSFFTLFSGFAICVCTLTDEYFTDLCLFILLKGRDILVVDWD